MYANLEFFMPITYKRLSKRIKNFLNLKMTLLLPNLLYQLRFHSKLKKHSNYDPLRACKLKATALICHVYFSVSVSALSPKREICQFIVGKVA